MTLTRFLALPQDDGQKKDVTAARDERESSLAGDSLHNKCINLCLIYFQGLAG